MRTRYTLNTNTTSTDRTVEECTRSLYSSLENHCATFNIYDNITSVVINIFPLHLITSVKQLHHYNI